MAIVILQIHSRTTFVPDVRQYLQLLDSDLTLGPEFDVLVMVPVAHARTNRASTPHLRMTNRPFLR